MLPRDLQSAVDKTPNDDELLLVAADAFESLGDPLRAELIRVQLRLEDASPYHTQTNDLVWRERLLLARGQARWLSALPRWAGVRLEGFERGFPAWISAEDPSALAAMLPQIPGTVTGLRLASLGKSGALRALPALPWLKRLVIRPRAAEGRTRELFGSTLIHLGLRSLELVEQVLGDEDIFRLADSASLRGLVALDLRDNFFGASGAAAIAQSPHLDAITSLDLGNFAPGSLHALGAEGLTALLQWPAFPRLISLGLSGQNISAASASELLSAFGTLQQLDLSHNPLGGLRLGPSAERSLERVSLVHCHLSGESLSALLALPAFANLCSLDVSRNNLGRGLSDRLVDAPAWRTLRSLAVQGTSLHRAVSPLAQSESGPIALDMSKCSLDGSDLDALSRAPWWRELRWLRLLANPISAYGAGVQMGVGSSAIAAARMLRSLHLGPEEIELHHLPESLVDLRLHSVSPSFASLQMPNLVSLHLLGPRLGIEQVERLASMPWFDSLIELHLSRCALPTGAIEALLAGKGALALRVLHLARNRLGAKDLRVLISKAKRLPDLAELSLDDKEVPSTLMEKFLSPGRFPSLRAVTWVSDVPNPRAQASSLRPDW